MLYRYRTINKSTEVSATLTPQDNTSTDDYKIKKHIIDTLKGRDGRDGRDGLPGTQGEKGDKGETGPAGCIKLIYMCNQYTLILLY